MEIKAHDAGAMQIAEVISEEVVIKSPEDALDLLGNLYYQGFDGIIISEEHISPDFFDLKTGMAGEILQKFSNYRVGLSIIGEFSKYPGNSIGDFIFESNKGSQISFVGSLSEALLRLSRR